ncbi:hypothetical protein CY35_03G042800 [Sphagnum magellanicum]|nr:hypothetical protein CY35_03G042800 [Sphagnum magellanicum]
MVVAEGLASMVITGMMKPSLSLGIMVCCKEACLTVYIGCHCSETMSKEHAIWSLFIGSAVLLSLFLPFKFLPQDLINTVFSLYFFVPGAVLAQSAWTYHNGRVHLLVEFTGIPGTLFCTFYVLKKHWLANKSLRLAFSIQGIEMLSLDSFKIGAILLAGLFIYNIFGGFFTPFMVSVAKSFDATIKICLFLIFPTGDAARPFLMLGLSDTVIPGTLQENLLFHSSFAGYLVGLLVTILIMNRFQTAADLSFNFHPF